MATEERRNEPEGEEVVYKTKIVEFLGRSTPIILQNDNGPCPLLAICNVLLLRNSLNLGPDAPEASEVSLQRLLSLVAEKLIDSNCNVQDKDDEYVSNQQQNIADAIDLLPRLATGIDVNVQFKKINDFEFTRECAIFDLLDIGLYHGWIVDPQDTDTAAAIASKSYNTLVGELVAFETRKSEGEDKNIPEDDYVDFAAATTATLGVPSPCVSRGRSFDDGSVSVPVEQVRRRGDIEEAVELMKALDLSRAETSNPVDVSILSGADCRNSSLSSEGITDTTSSVSVAHAGSLVAPIEDQSEKSHHSVLVEPHDHNESNGCKDEKLYAKAFLTENDCMYPSIASGNNISQSDSKGSGESLNSNDAIGNARTDMLIHNQAIPCKSTDEAHFDGYNTYGDLTNAAVEDQSVIQPCKEDFSISQIPRKPTDNLIDSDSTISSAPDAPCENFQFPNVRKEFLDYSEGVTSSLEGSEPMYEGEEHILDPGHLVHEDQEPVYEGEMILAEQADKMEEDSCSINSTHTIQQHWKLIKNFFENSASQLTIYGLFCLQEGLKERELGVFFRNNHFSTMFKFNGQLYLLATDQGYINQPDLVWEKLNEVNGDTIFMTGNFKEFKAENQVSDSWNEQSAMTNTADYLATLEGSSPSSSALNSDLQLAIALQQQEFEQQPQRNQQPPQQHQQQSQPQSSISGRSKLVTGPQVARNSGASQKNDSKGKEGKEKCVMM